MGLTATRRTARRAVPRAAWWSHRDGGAPAVAELRDGCPDVVHDLEGVLDLPADVAKRTNRRPARHPREALLVRAPLPRPLQVALGALEGVLHLGELGPE